MGMVEIYAPAEAGNSFLGLDTIDRFKVDSRIGTLDDIRRLVDLAHGKGLKIISIDNFGYSQRRGGGLLEGVRRREGGARDARDADVPVGRFSRGAAAAWRGQARSLLHGAPDAPGRLQRGEGARSGQPSARAGKHYWSRWDGVDLAGNHVRLPQYNWFSDEFQEECEKVVRFWMDTGVDGMMIDAVNWYVGCDWAKTRKRMTDVINSYGSEVQPAGRRGRVS